MRRVILTIIASFCLVTAEAFTNEFGGWFSANATLGFTRKFSLTARGEYRARANWTKTDLFFFRLTANYRICPYVAVGAAYDNLNILKGNELNIYHRAFANVSGTYSYNNFAINLLERFVYAYKQNDGTSTYTLRSRLMLSYNIEQKQLKPYISAEIFNNLGDNFKVKYLRYYAGIHVKCDSRNALQFYYCCQQNFAESANIHTLGIDYFFKLCWYE